MSTSIASQLQALKSFTKANGTESVKRPLTRASLLYDPKEAADIDLDTIFNISLSGLELLISTNERFRNYKNDLFSLKSREVDRELLTESENKQINLSISSYLRLLSGYIELLPAVKTLEYLIRRYKVHIYNAEDLILCALPYHDTHTFVKIVQLIPSGNNVWKFLDGVRESGAPPPRQVIVQQCIRDMGVLESLCTYAKATNKFQPSRPVIGLCTSVIVEVIRSVATLENDTVTRILPYVLSGLQLDAKRDLDQKAGALMIISSLAGKVGLLPSLVNSLIRTLSDVARGDAKVLADVQWVRLPIMTLINLVQLQSVETIPKKAIESLNEIRNFSMILSGLSEDFNVDKFLAVMLDSFIEYSLEDDRCLQMLVSALENVPIKFFIDRVVDKVFAKISRNKIDAVVTVNWAKQILASIYKKYPLELRGSIHKVLKTQSKKESVYHDIVCQILDGSSDPSHGISDSKIWFALEHPRAEVRRNTLSGLDVKEILSIKSTDLQRFDTIQDALLRRLRDDDLGVVREVMKLEGLFETISSPSFLDALQDVLRRCVRILMQSTSNDKSLAIDVAVSCLQSAISTFRHHGSNVATLAKMTFPLLLVLPKTWRLNLKTLELIKEINWPLYENLRSLPVASKRKDRGDKTNYPKQEKNFELEQLTSTNMENIAVLAESFLKHHQQYVPWLVGCCNELELSKTLFFLMILQSCMMPEKDAAQFSALIAACLPVLKSEWENLQSEKVLSPDKFDIIPYQSCKPFVERLCDANISELNTEILVYIFLRLPEALSKTGATAKTLQDLFIFFSSQRQDVFKEHIHYFMSVCTMSMCQFLLNLFTEEGPIVDVKAGSLASVTYLCTTAEGGMTLKLLTSFPAILVPLSHDNQELRVAAMSCLEALHLLWERSDLAKSRNGSSAVWIDFLGVLLDLIVQQKRMILSDRNFLSSLLSSLLSSSPNSLLVHQNIGKRFDESTKNDILVFILGSALGLSAYAKLKILSLLKGLGTRILRIRGVELLLNDLLKRRLCDKLSTNEVGILCVLLEICCKSTSSLDSCTIGDFVLKALQLNSMSTEVHAVIEPCLTVLRNVNNSLYLKIEYQDLLLRALVFLFRSNNAEIQKATKEALQRIDIDCTTICRIFKSLRDPESDLSGLQHGKKKKITSSHQKVDIHVDWNTSDENSLVFTNSLLDLVLLKKGMRNRTLLVEPLFCFLQSPYMNGGLLPSTSEQENDARNVFCDVVDIQQTIFLLLEDIISSTINNGTKMVHIDESDIKLLISFARTANDTATRNHVFSLLSAIAKVLPDKVVEHILDILVVTGESAVTQWDRQSQRVYEDLISAVVPCWLSKSDDMTKLLQIFVDVLPQVSEHRRVSVVVPLLRNLGEPACVGSLLFLLFHSLSSTASLSIPGDNELPLYSITSLVCKKWEYVLAMQLTEQYSSMIWLPSIELLLQLTGTCIWTRERFVELVVSMQFISDKLEDPELVFKLDSGKDTDSIQTTLGGLMEQVIFHLQMVDLRKKQIDVSSRIRKELKEYTHSVTKTITRYLMPSTFFKLVTKLLGNSEKSTRKKALRMLSDSVKGFVTNDLKHGKRGMNATIRSSWLQLDEIAQDSFKHLFLEILNLLDDSKNNLSSSIEIEAVSTLEVVCSWFPLDHSMLSMCLRSICRNIASEDPSISSCCLRATGSLINLLGPKALSELPGIMKSVLKKAQDIFSSVAVAITGNDLALAPPHMMDSLFMAILITLEAITDKIGGFLNPYLEDILRLVVLCPVYTSASDPKLKARADVLRKLMSHKIPVRLLLPPLLRIYSDAIEFGESSLSIAFEMLGSLVGAMDRSSIGAYHAKIFDLCLLALDIRGQHPASVKDVDFLEKCVLEVMVTLTLKLTESMFRPLFIKSIEWSALNTIDVDPTGRKKFDRMISFYGLVNKLAESHRSLFVPYFKYLLDGCVHSLTYTDTEDAIVDLNRKKKRAKLQEACSEHKDINRSASLEIWHLRALILSSLSKCFLYDTGSLKFLDSSNFQVLLKPIVSQLVIEPPACLDQYPNIPSVKEVDDLLVACVGQMAVTAGSDLLWKPLNHEVLMQTREDKIRPRMLALRIVRYFVENLKEEYLALLAETIPFLGELLEDAELSVKSLAQEILKDMETLSGESLRQYL